MCKATLAYALASQPLQMLHFSGTVTTASVHLPTAGGIAGDGMPIPYAGTLIKIIVFDGSTIRTDSTNVQFAANDRFSLYCQNVGATFTLKTRVNGVSSNLQIASVPFNSTLQVTLVFALNRN